MCSDTHLWEPSLEERISNDVFDCESIYLNDKIESFNYLFKTICLNWI